jgi:hypothetical protein
MGSLEAHEHRLERCNEGTKNGFQSKFNKLSQKPKEGGRKPSENIKNKDVKKGNFPPCGICRRKSHLESDCWFKGKPQCRNCKRFGHLEKACRLKKNHQANFYEENDANLFYACQAATLEKKRYMVS